MLAGHKGSGKTTELLRLQQRLQTAEAEDRYFVVFCSADDDIDRNDVDFPDVLIAIIRQMATQLRERAKIELKPGYFKDRWQRVKGLLASEVDFETVGIEVGMATISMAIKNSPDTRKRIREALEPDAANDVIGEAVLQLKEYYAGLVVIIDDLDKMVVRHHPGGGWSGPLKSTRSTSTPTTPRWRPATPTSP